MLGKVITADGYGVSFLTSTGHVVYMGWNGTVPTGQIYYTGANCGGTAYLNSDGGGQPPYWGRQVTDALVSLLALAEQMSREPTTALDFVSFAMDQRCETRC